jgi:hypothetical protein
MKALKKASQKIHKAGRARLAKSSENMADAANRCMMWGTWNAVAINLGLNG